MDWNLFQIEAQRFFRHAFVPLVTWFVAQDYIAVEDHEAAVEALAIGGSYLAVYVWSRKREKKE